MVIYKITNTLNGHSYVGKTTKQDANERFKKHIQNSKTGNTHLYNAMRKYGVDKFIITHLAENVNNLDEAERKFISLLKPEYNMTEGGEGGDTSSSPNFKASMKAYHSNKPKKEYATYGMKDKKHSNETKTKQSKTHTKNWEALSPEDRKARSKKITGNKNGMYGKTPANAIPVTIDGVTYPSKAAASRAGAL